MKIPFASIGLSGIPEKMKFNLCRTVRVPEPESTLFIRSDNRHYAAPSDSAIGERFGTLFFGPQRPAVALKKKSDFSQADIVIEAEALVLPESKFACSILTVIEPNGRVFARDEQQPRFDSLRVLHTIQNVPDGLYRLRYTYGEPAGGPVLPAYYGGQGTKRDKVIAAEAEKGRTVLYEWPLKVQRAMTLETIVKLKDRGKILVADLGIKGKLPVTGKLKYHIILKDKNGGIIQDLGQVAVGADRTVFTAQLPELAEREYYDLHLLLLENEDVLAETTAEFGTPPAPDWLDFDMTVPPGVPAPYRPVRYKNRVAKVWGREYHF